MTIRYLLGGPANSGKSTFILSLVERLRAQAGVVAEAIEFDVWSNSYPAFLGEIEFRGRPKHFGLDWDWQTPLFRRIEQFNHSTAAVVFGDLPGRLDEAIGLMCERALAQAAIVVSNTVAGLAEWGGYFAERGLPVEFRFLTFEHEAPMVLVGMNRVLDRDNQGVVSFGDLLLKRLCRAATAE